MSALFSISMKDGLTKTTEKDTFSISLHKSGFESSSKKTEQDYRVPYTISNNRLYF
jgi:hypothetical protein